MINNGVDGVVRCLLRLSNHNNAFYLKANNNNKSKGHLNRADTVFSAFTMALIVLKL